MEVLEVTGTGVSHAVTVGMLKSGYRPRSEPYLLGLLKSFRASHLARVRSKSRILVPKGRCLMGCLDETAQLAYGEVFLQVSSKLRRQSFVDDGLDDFRSLNDIHNDSYVVTGPVVVAKNPCLHPGDIRVLRAVDIPQLGHMVDCVVFPQGGHRCNANFTKSEIGAFFYEDLILEGNSFREYLDAAWKLKMCYDMKLLSLMDQYDIKTEMEAISGNFSSPSQYFMRRQSEVKDRIRMAVNSLRKEARSWFKSGYHCPEGYEIDESIELTEWEKLAKASAWYYLTYHPDYVFREGIAKGKHKNLTLISFPWTVHETLLAIKKSRSEVCS